MSQSSQNTRMNLPGKMSISFIFSLTLLAPSLNVRTAKATAVLAIFRLFVCLGWIFPCNTVQRFISVLSAALRTLFSSSVLARSLMTDLMVSIVVCGKFPVCLQSFRVPSLSACLKVHQATLQSLWNGLSPDESWWIQLAHTTSLTCTRLIFFFSPDSIPVVNLYFVNLFVCQAAVSSKGFSNCQQGITIFLRFEADCHSFLDISDTPIFSHFYFRTIGFNFIYLKKTKTKNISVPLAYKSGVSELVRSFLTTENVSLSGRCHGSR